MSTTVGALASDFVGEGVGALAVGRFIVLSVGDIVGEGEGVGALAVGRFVVLSVGDIVGEGEGVVALAGHLVGQ